MNEEEKTPLTVKGLGENTVPPVTGLNTGDNVDVTSTPVATTAAPGTFDPTSTPTVSQPAEPARFDPMSTPTVSQPAAPAKFDPMSAPTVSQPTAQPTSFDPTAMPTATSGGSSSNVDWVKYAKIGGIVLGVIVVIAIIVSLVGGKKIVCTEEDTYSGMAQKTVMTFKFDGDGKIKSVSVEMSLDYSKADEKPSDSEVEAMAKSLTDGKDGAKYKVSNNVITVTYTTSKEEDLKLFKDTTYDKMKELIEKNDGKLSSFGTCKVK